MTKARWITFGRLILLVSALAAAIMGQLQILYGLTVRDRPLVDAGLRLTLAGIALLLVGTRGVKLPIPTDSAPESIDGLHIKWRWLIVSLVLLVWTIWRSTVQEAHIVEHLIVWTLALFAFVQAIRSPHTVHDDKWALKRWEYGLLLVLFVVAMLVRGVNLNSEPRVFDLDEAKFAWRGAMVRHNNFIVSPFAPGYQSYPMLYPALMGASSLIFGQTMEAARLPSAIIGSLGILALYLLARELYGWQVALLASGFMLSWSYHIQFSRLALNQVGDALFATLAFYFLLRGLRRGSATDYALCGLAVGTAQFFYLGGRIVPLAMVAYVLFLWRRQRELIQQWRLLLLIPLAAFIVTLPQNAILISLNKPLITHSQPYTMTGEELQQALESGKSTLQFAGEQVSLSFLALFSLYDREGWYGPGSTLPGVVGGAPLILGLVIVVAVAWRHPKWVLPIIWGGLVILIGSALSVAPPQYQRYFPAAPAIALLVGLGAWMVARLPDMLLTHFGAQLRLTNTVVITLGGVLCVANLAFYLGVYVPDARYLAKPSTWTLNHLAREMVSAYAKGSQVVVDSDPAQLEIDATQIFDRSEIVNYMMADNAYTVIDGAQDSRLNSVSPAKPFAIFVPHSRQNDLEKLQQKLPGGTITEFHNDLPTEDGSFAFYVYAKQG
ncbi:MAG: glycosyltransferase family 39 protein [Chloroflexota bacterium]